MAERDAYANLLLPELLAQRGLTGRDAALATELTYGTLRGRGSYDAVLALCSDRDLATLDPPVREVLRLGTHQLLATRVAAHAAVATSVTLVRQAAGLRPAGFVNAVLRRVATRDLSDWLQIAAPDRAADPAGHLAVRHSHPRWIVEAFAAALGEALDGPLAQTESVLAADNERPRVHVCVLPGRADPAELIAAGCEPARWSPYGGYLAEGDPAGIPAVAAGRAGVQDEASQLAAIAVSRAGLAAGGALSLHAMASAGSTCARAWAARRGCSRAWPSAAGCPADRRRAARAPRPAGPARNRGRGHERRHRGRRHPAGLAGRCLQPGARRRALHRPRRAAADDQRPAGGVAPATWPACRRCSGSCCGRRWTPPRRAASSGT